MPGKRDEFPQDVKIQLAKRVGFRCSKPGCERPTVGPSTDHEKSVTVGIAAHITAAAPGGPRYDANLTPDERRSASNGIWLCAYCGSLIDKDDPRFPVDLIRGWKAVAEDAARRAVEERGPVKPAGSSGAAMSKEGILVVTCEWGREAEPRERGFLVSIGNAGNVTLDDVELHLDLQPNLPDLGLKRVLPGGGWFQAANKQGPWVVWSGRLHPSQSVAATRIMRVGDVRSNPVPTFRLSIEAYARDATPVRDALSLPLWTTDPGPVASVPDGTIMVMNHHLVGFRTKAEAKPSSRKDAESLDSLKRLLPSGGSIRFLRTNNFAGFSFDPQAPMDLERFLSECENTPDFFFQDNELEAIRLALRSAAQALLKNLATETFLNDKGRAWVPPEWEIEQPERFREVVNYLHQKAETVVNCYDELIRLARVNLP